MDMKELIGIFAPQGIWAVLSLVLLFYILKGQEKRDIRQDERDQKYQETIIQLTGSLQDLNEIKSLLNDKLK